jgi:poly-gamma-glutamate capsule biosynthesis protein CapA/YwtB (metallophosphatase superfamily)
MQMPPRKLIAVYAAVLAIAVAGWSAALLGAGPRQLWHKSLFTFGVPDPVPGEEITAKTITLAGVGDIVMGDGRSNMPPNDGRDFFAKVKPLLSADLMMGNLEEPITNDTGFVKCAPTALKCHQFRVPPQYARHLKDAGFHLVNLANNHDRDYGQQGMANTVTALESAGVMHTGAKGEITIADVKGLKVGVLGFGFYTYQNNINDVAAARDFVQKAATQADIVVIQVHWGDEGADKAHVKPGLERLNGGEPRGDPIAFAHAVIDAGADIVFGHGPHTIRAMEIYKGRLIAYSLGNFAGGGGLSGDGQVGWGGVLQATVSGDGTFKSGQFTSTYFTSHPGHPVPDPQNRGLKLLRDLTKADLPRSGAPISVSGAISTL